MTTEAKTKPASDLFEQALRSYEQALKTGLKLQEESAKMFMGSVNQGAPADVQKKFKAIADEAIPQVEKVVDEGVRLIEQNSRTAVDLFKKAVAAAQATSAQDAQAKGLAFYEGCLDAVRSSATAVTQASNKAAESWLGYVRRSTEPLTAKK